MASVFDAFVRNQASAPIYQVVQDVVNNVGVSTTGSPTSGAGLGAAAGRVVSEREPGTALGSALGSAYAPYQVAVQDAQSAADRAVADLKRQATAAMAADGSLPFEGPSGPGGPGGASGGAGADPMSLQMQHLTTIRDQALAALAERYSMGQENLQEQRVTGRQGINASANVADAELDLQAERSMERSATIEQNLATRQDQQAAERDARVAESVKAVRQSGGDVAAVVSKALEGDALLGQTRDQGANALAQLQQLGVDNAAAFAATSELVQQSALSTLQNNFSEARAALDAAELEQRQAIEQQFLEQQMQLELAAAAGSSSGRGGGGGGSGSSDSLDASAASYLGEAFGIDPSLILAGDRFGYADNILNMGTEPAPGVYGDNQDLYDAIYGSVLSGSSVPQLEESLFGPDNTNNFDFVQQQTGRSAIANAVTEKYTPAAKKLAGTLSGVFAGIT